MAKKPEKPNTLDKYTRIPVTLKDEEDHRLALSVKQAVERREGRSQTWAVVVRLAFRALAKELGVKCK